MRTREMQTLSPEQIAELLGPYLQSPATGLICKQVSSYLGLLGRWNARVSLTSVREAALVVQRHFGESFFLGEHLPQFQSMLDLGSGAGFPGIPVALLRPAAAITLAESQQKKAAFLREAVESLGLGAKVWGDRVERMPPALKFDVVALRAVDRMENALVAAVSRVAQGGTMAFLAGGGTPLPLKPADWDFVEYEVPLSSGRLIVAKAR